MAVKSSFKNMVICLFAICLVCSGLLAGVYDLTKKPIEQAEEAKNEAAIKEVLPDTAVAIDPEERTIEYKGRTYTYNRAFDKDGNPAGCAIDVESSGFGGPIKIKVGFDKDGVIWNTKVLSQSETPGLGAKCVEPAFAKQFQGKNPNKEPLVVRKKGDKNGNIDAITASTITSRAYVDGVALAAEVYNAIGQTPMPLDKEE